MSASRVEATAARVVGESDAPRRTAWDAVLHTRMLVWRNLKSQARDPQAAVFMFIQPIMFVLMFRYVFGGAIQTPGQTYVDYLLPGIFVQTVAFAGITTAVGLATDLKTGIVDRLRSLPMASWVVLAGRTLADTFRSVIVLVILGLVGLAVGWRPDGGPGRILVAACLLILFGHALLWLYALMGLRSSSAEAAQAATFPVIFPLVFASSVFVPVDTMPSWLRGFAENQPLSVTTDAVRALVSDQPVGSLLWQSALWSMALIALLLPLAAWQYRKTNQ